MSDTNHTVKPDGKLPRAKLKKTRRAWWLWLIPLGAVALCVWFAYRDYIATGPLITIYFQDASGLEENNTQVRYLGATVGQVKSIELTKGAGRVKVTARLIGSATQLARQGSLFWIVRPELTVGGITGLRTIISGEYVSVRPGIGPRTNDFVGSEKEPIAEEPGDLRITFLAPSLSSLQERSGIFYFGIQVGKVTGYQLSSDGQGVTVHGLIQKDYTPLVRANSKFWNAGGLDFSFGLFHGAQISAESPKTLLGGGIAFATPPDLGPPATDGAVFRLYDKPDEAWKNWMPVIHLHLPPNAALGAPASNVNLRQ